MSGAGIHLFLLKGHAQIELDAELGKGGEGVVSAVRGRPGIVAKIFHAGKRQILRRKLEGMLQKPPTRTNHSGHTLISWPQDLVVDERGNFLGYIMSSVEGGEKIYKIKHPKERKGDARTRLFRYERLVAVAQNLASAVEFAHAEGLVIGDLNAQNVLVASTTAVSLIDVDSFQFTDVAGHCYLCGVGTPEYLAPELMGMKLSERRRDATSDLFSLGVLIHELLMEGQHPYAGVDRSSGQNPPDIAGRIRAGLFPGAKTRRVLADVAPVSPPRAMLADDVVRLFHRCFDDGHGAPERRPSAREWRHALRSWATQLGECATKNSHVFDRRLSSCPWCEREGSGLAMATPAPASVQFSSAPSTPRSTGSPLSLPPPPAPSLSSIPSVPAAKSASSALARRQGQPWYRNPGRVIGLGSVAAMAIGLAYTQLGPKGLSEVCSRDADCTSRLCVNGRCATERAAIEEACSKDDDCQSGQCVGSSCRECRTSARCANDESCDNHRCVKVVPKAECQSDLECPRALTCVGGKCVKKTGEGARCAEAADCVSHLCIVGQCRTTRLADGSSCVTSNDCVNNCLSGICAPAPSPAPPPVAAPSVCARPVAWDRQVRGWDKGASGYCTGRGLERGYFLRLALNQTKDESAEAIAAGWSRYVNTYLQGAACPPAKEMVFFDRANNHGAGILFPERPPHWSDVVAGEPDWLLRDKSSVPVLEDVCFFSAEESRRPDGW